MALAVFKNGHPKIIGDFSLVLVFTTMKFVDMYELPTCTQISSKIPMG